MQVSIYGCGYVGLVTGACLAEIGHNVICMDVDERKVSQLNRGETTIYEPGLDVLLQKNLDNGRLCFTQDIDLTVAHGDIQFIAVNTPPLASGAADLQNVFRVAESIAGRMDSYKLIVNKSTVPVGTAEQVTQHVLQTLKAAGRDVEFGVASNPEFLKEGMAVQDFLYPERIIIGVADEPAKRLLSKLYHSFQHQDACQLIVTSIASAELGKYAANAMLATRISFMNEMSQIAERVGADIEEVKQCMQHDSRIGKHFLNAGCGFGGSCLPKDLKALQHTAKQVGVAPRLVAAVEAVNQHQRHVLFENVRQHFKGRLSGLTVALWGLAFKPGTDDIREATSRYLLQDLWAAGVKVQAYDPIANEVMRRQYPDQPDFLICDSPAACCERADALVIVTEWDEFKNYPLSQIQEKLQQPVIFDGRNIYDPETLRAKGWQYYGIGRHQMPQLDITLAGDVHGGRGVSELETERS